MVEGMDVEIKCWGSSGCEWGGGCNWSGGCDAQTRLSPNPHLTTLSEEGSAVVVCLIWTGEGSEIISGESLRLGLGWAALMLVLLLVVVLGGIA